MQKKFLSNLILLLFLNVLVKPFWLLGIDLSVQNRVGAEEYGFYFAIFNFSMLFNILLDAGITNYNNRNISQNRQLLNKHLSGIVVMKFGLSLLYFIFIMLGGFIIGYNEAQLKILMFLGINQFLLSFIAYLRSNIAGLHLFKTDSFLSVLDKLLMIIICSILLWGNITDTVFHIEWFIYAQTSSYLLAAVIASFIVIQKSKFKKLTWNRPFFLMILKQSMPFALLILLMTFYNRVDSVLIERLLSDDGNRQTGIYASAFRLLDATNMIAVLFTVLLLPIFARMIKLNENVNELLKLSFTLLIIPAIIISISSYFFQYEIMSLLYIDHRNESAEVFGIIMFSFISISTTYIFGTLLTANGSLKQLNIIAASGLLIHLVLSFILIPKLKAQGAAYAGLTTQTITAFAQLLLAVSLFKLKINYRFILSLLLFAIGVIIIGWSTKQLNIRWEIGLLSMISISFILAFITRLFNVKAMMNILRESN